MFRAFFGYSREDVEGREVDHIEKREHLVKTIAPAFATDILNTLAAEGWTVASMSNNVYVLERLTITKKTIGGMSLTEYLDNTIMLDSVLKLWHAPYIDKN